MRPVGADAVVPPRDGWATRLRAWRAGRRPRVRLGDGVRVGRGVVLEAAPGCRVVSATARRWATARASRRCAATSSSGPARSLGDRASVRGDGPVTVGADCVIGAWARVEGPARLGDRARLGAHAAALAGADLGPGAVLGSYAVVDGPVAARAVVEGNAAAP